MADWFCIYSTISGEFKALEALRARNFTVYLPLATRTKLLRGQQQTLKTPLLARYLFICLDNFNRWGEIKEIPAVQEILPHEFEPQPVPEHEIERIWNEEQEGRFVFDSTKNGKRRERIVLRSLSELAILREQVQADGN